jgi:hypothetical protein
MKLTTALPTAIAVISHTLSRPHLDLIYEGRAVRLETAWLKCLYSQGLDYSGEYKGQDRYILSLSPRSPQVPAHR